jgi:hypothetical protein
MLNRNGAIMKKRVALFTVILTSMIVQALNAEDQLFSLEKYGLKWGMLRPEVISLKDPNLHCDNLYCCISDFEFLGGKYLCSLYFEENKLTYINIMIKDDITKKNGIALLDKYTEKINKYYGKNKSYKRENKLPEKNSEGQNILYFDIASYWTIPVGKVHLVLTGRGDSCYLEISYFSLISFKNIIKDKTPKVGYEIDYSDKK